MIGIEEEQAVLRVMKSGILSGYQGNYSEAFYGGEEVKSLEAEWASFFDVKHAIAVNSATSGLWCACSAVGISQKDYVIVSPYSMTCSATMPLHFGAFPVFADIEPDYYCLNPESVEETIIDMIEHGKPPKAIIVVNLFGQPYDSDKINAIAKKYGMYIIEDAAQAIGAKYKGKYTGTLGDIGVFSLNVHKLIQCGEGGIVVTNDDSLAWRIRLAMNHSESVMNDIVLKNKTGIAGTNFDLVGMNMRMTELSAAIAREQLKKLNRILNQVREHSKYFNVKIRPECEHSFYRYAWNAYENSYTMSEWDNVKELCNVKEHYITPIYRMPLFRKLGYDPTQCLVCEEVDKNIMLAWLKGMG